MPTELLGTTEENSRRNLFVFSCLIIIGWWLDINPAILISEKLYINLNPFKLSIVYIVLFGYLALTFLRSPHTETMARMYKEMVAKELYIRLLSKDSIQAGDLPTDFSFKDTKGCISETDADGHRRIIPSFHIVFTKGNDMHHNEKNNLEAYYKSNLITSRLIDKKSKEHCQLLRQYICIHLSIIYKAQKVAVYYFTVVLVALIAFVILIGALCVALNNPTSTSSTYPRSASDILDAATYSQPHGVVSPDNLFPYSNALTPKPIDLNAPPR